MILAQNSQLTIPQLTLLNRGLNFIPTRGSNKNIKQQTRLDLQNYHRRLKIIDYYKDKPDSQKQPFTPASNWTPPDVNLPQNLKHLIQLDLTYFQNHFKPPRIRPNLSPEENAALIELKNNKKITKN